MYKLRGKLLANLVKMVIGFGFLSFFPWRRVQMILRFLFMNGPFTLEKLIGVWRADPQSLILLAIFLFLVLMVLFSFVRFFSALTGIIRYSGSAGGAVTGQQDAGTRQYTQASSAYGRQNGKTSEKSKEIAAARLRKMQEEQRMQRARENRDRLSKRTSGGIGRTRRGDTGISYTYTTGKERYMQQLDDLLRDGVVTREEYLELRRSWDKSGGR